MRLRVLPNLVLLVALAVDTAAAERPRADRGDDAKYWEDHSVVYAEVADKRAADDGGFSLVLRAKGTISGTYDAAAIPETSVKTRATVYRISGFEDVKPPDRGTEVIVVLAGSRLEGANPGEPQSRYSIARGAMFMPDGHAPLLVAGNDPSAKVAHVLRAIQDKRRGAPPEPGASNGDYWRTHSLILATVFDNMQAQGQAPKAEIALRPKLRLSGTLDPGKVPELSATIDPTKYGHNFKMPPAGAAVLALVVQANGVYSIAEGSPTFMPGDHAPICEVKDFSDQKVLDTLHRVQELRRKKTAKPGGDAPVDK